MPGNQETKVKILSTASKLFQKQGYHATGLNQIIKESGCPKGSLYYYFPEGKEQLAAEAINKTKEAAVAGLQHVLTQYDSVETSLEYFLEQHVQFDPNRSHDGTPLALITLETWHMSERLRTVCKEAYDALVFTLKEKFIEANWPEDEAEEISYLIFSMIEGSSIFAITQQSNKPFNRACKAIMEMVRAKQREITTNGAPKHETNTI